MLLLLGAARARAAGVETFADVTAVGGEVRTITNRYVPPKADDRRPGELGMGGAGIEGAFGAGYRQTECAFLLWTEKCDRFWGLGLTAGALGFRRGGNSLAGGTVGAEARIGTGIAVFSLAIKSGYARAKLSGDALGANLSAAQIGVGLNLAEWRIGAAYVAMSGLRRADHYNFAAAGVGLLIGHQL